MTHQLQNLKQCHTTTVLWPFFWDHMGEPVPEENFWTLRCKGRLKEADTLQHNGSSAPFLVSTVVDFHG